MWELFSRMITTILIHSQIIHRILSSNEVQFNRNVINNTQTFHLWFADNARRTAERLIPGECLLWSDWRSVDWTIPLEQLLTATNRLHLLTNELSLLMEDGSLETGRLHILVKLRLSSINVTK
jgi:hypothetical protein